MQLPLLGPHIILSQVPRAVGAGGYHVIDGRAIYVSRGVGHEGGQAPRIRFLCPPEVSLLLLGAPLISQSSWTTVYVARELGS